MDSDELMDLYGIPADQRAGLLRAAVLVVAEIDSTPHTVRVECKRSNWRSQ